MTTTQFRAAIFSEIRAWAAASFPALPVFYENGPVPDEDAIGPIWLDVEIRWYGSSVASVGDVIRKRHTGAIAVMCYYREAEGTDLSDQVIDTVGARLGARRLGGAVTHAEQRTVPTHFHGWYKTGALVPFVLG